MASLDYFKAGLNLSGSLLSVIGTTFIIVSYIILPRRQHIRHAFIINLTIADFINSLNNTSSGLAVIVRGRDLSPGPGCVANGFIGQVSVQAVDFSILAIVLITLWIVTSPRSVVNIGLTKTVLLCACSWILPFITGFTALFLGYYRPVQTNWCWIQVNPPYLRYVLTHGWRFLVIFVVTGICIYIQVYLRRHRKETAVLKDPNSSLPSLSESGENRDGAYALQSMLSDDSGESGQSAAENSEGSKKNWTEFVTWPQPAKVEKRTIEKTMLLNAYPFFYVVLWIPGILNRIFEATGYPVYALGVMQASTQFIGFANSITFGWNEQIWKHLKARFITASFSSNPNRYTIS